MYIEGNDLGYANKGTAFYNMLGATYNADGNNISSLSGQDGSIVEGKSYNFIQGSGLNINTYIDEISSNGGTLIFECNAGTGRAVTCQGQDESYKVIYSTFVFGGVRTDDARNELMKIYMDWLLGSTPIADDCKPDYAAHNSNILSVVLTSDRYLNFTLASPAQVKADFYSISGKLVQHLINGEFNDGTHIVKLNDNSLSDGTYILRLESNGESVKKGVFLIK
jgi:hypothetical protein